MKRGEPVHGPAGPIIVCTRNDDLQAIVDATPVDRRKGGSAGRALPQPVSTDPALRVRPPSLNPKPRCCPTSLDLVFIQNGMLQPWLDAKGLGANTQV